MCLKKISAIVLFSLTTLISANEYSFAKTTPTEQLESKMRSVMALAEKGDVESQFVLSRLYYKTGVYSNKHFEQSAKWAARAAKQNHREAQMFLGALYLKGEGVKKDQATAYALFKLAAEKGEPFSVKNLPEIKKLLTEKERKRVDEMFAKGNFLKDNI